MKMKQIKVVWGCSGDAIKVEGNLKHEQCIYHHRSGFFDFVLSVKVTNQVGPCNRN